MYEKSYNEAELLNAYMMAEVMRKLVENIIAVME